MSVFPAPPLLLQGAVGIGQVGNVVVWGNIVPDPITSYTPITPNNVIVWSEIVPNPITSYTPITPDPGSVWTEIEPSSSAVWTEIAA
jgi:hypothetical protein